MRLQAEGVATMWSAPGDYSCMEFIPCTRSDHLGLFKEGNVAPGSLREQHAERCGTVLCASCWYSSCATSTMRSLPACALLTKARRREEPTREV